MRPYLAIAVVAALTVAFFSWWQYDFFCQNDNLLVFHSAYPEIARALSKGQFPWLSESCWVGGSFYGEYQFGVFSAFHLPLVWLLSLIPDLYIRADFYTCVYLTVCGVGAYRLGRRLKLDPDVAGLVALGFSWNGFFARWGCQSWMPLLSSFAWLPWVWAELEAPVVRIAPLALAVYLVTSAGWPYTVAWLLLLFGVYSLRRWREAPKIVIGAALGFALSSPAILGLVEHTGQALRTVDHWAHRLEPASLLGLILPLRELGIEDTLFPHQAANLNCGLIPTLLLMAALVGRHWQAWRQNPHIVVMMTSSLVLALAPAFGPFRWSFRWCGMLLPSLVLLVALAWPELRRARAGLNPGALGLASLIVAFFTAPGSSQWMYCQLALHVVVSLTLWWMWRTRRRELLLLLGLTWLCSSASLFFERPAGWHRWASPQRTETSNTLKPGVRTLSLYTWTELREGDQEALAEFRPGNLGMVEGLRILNGATSIMAEPVYFLTGFGLAGESEVAVSAVHLLPRLRPGATIERLGIEQLIVSHAFNWDQQLQEHGWTLRHRGKAANVWTRLGSPGLEVAFLPQAVAVNSLTGVAQLHVQEPDTDLVPILAPYRDLRQSLEQAQKFSFAPATIKTIRPFGLNLHVEVENSSKQPGLLRMNRPFYPGYRVRLNNRETPLLVCDLAVMAVVVPAGFDGTVELAFEPLSKRWGLPIAGLALLVLSGIVQWNRLRSRYADR